MKKQLAHALPSALTSFSDIKNKINGRQVALFLDYDGTLTPIASHPENAHLTEDMREILKRLAHHYPILVISGRDLRDVMQRVALQDIYYAGSHGFEIHGPHNLSIEIPEAEAAIPNLEKALKELNALATHFSGALVQNKRFAIAFHFRNVAEEKKQNLKDGISQIARQYPNLRLTHGKEVMELSPAIDWDKGKAVLWLLKKIPMEKPFFSIYLGDDLTDEDAFKVLGNNGIGIIVKETPRDTFASYALEDPSEVKQFLERLL